MISICCCAFNARHDVEFFVRHLARHNDQSAYEICLVVDDRCNDGAVEYYKTLQKEFPNLKLAVNTFDDTIKYLQNCIDFYKQERLFDGDFILGLQENLEKYKAGTLFDPTGAYFWLSSGMLYNKAVSMASGDLLVITPADFIYLFNLTDLEAFVKTQTKNGFYYGKPNAIWSRVANFDKDVIFKHIDDVHSGRLCPVPEYRWDTNQFYRNYLNAPAPLENYWLADIRNNTAINMGTHTWEEIYKYNAQSLVQDGGVQAGICFHGFHIMTRAAYDAIGGFTEVYYSRAFPDDCMTRWGHHFFGHPEMPTQFSVGWIIQHALILGGLEPAPDNWRDIMDAKEPNWRNHPLPGSRDGKFYLHSGCKIINAKGQTVDHQNYVHQAVVDKLIKYPKPIRF